MTANVATASTVRALVRGTRAALTVQLIVAVLALGATLWAVATLPKVVGEMQQAQAQRNQAVEQRTAALTESQNIRQASQLLLRGRDAFVGGRTEAAVLLLSQAVGVYDQDPLAWSLLAQAYHRAQRDAEAIQAVRRSLAIDPSSFADVARLATYQCATHDNAGSAATLNAAPAGFIAALREDANLAETRADLSAACGIAGLNAPVSGYTENFTGSDAQPYKVTLIYLHIRDEADRADARRLQQALQQAGYRVPGIELVAPPHGYGQNVRYYYEPQATETHTIAQLVTTNLRQLGIAGWRGWTPREVSLAGAYDNLPRDRVEVWLPPRAAQAPN